MDERPVMVSEFDYINAPIDPVETAGNKLSALSWRPFAHADGQKNVDVTFVRHAYDLGALAEVAAMQPDAFVGSLPPASRRVAISGSGSATPAHPFPLEDRLARALDSLRTPYYRDAFNRYVESMSYEPRAERVEFGDTLDRVGELARVVTDHPQGLHRAKEV